ncbi:MAG TPA: acetyl-CoA hydrolase/transferase family protein [Symbiobacteriaceae bacterium]
MEERIRHAGLRKRVMEPSAAAELIKDGDIVAISGFTRSGDPKVVLQELVKQHDEGVRSVQIDLWTGASVSEFVDGALAQRGMMRRRLPFQSEPHLRGEINKGNIMYIDQHLSHTAEWIRQGVMPAPDVAIIEAVAIREDGAIVPSTSVGNSPVFATAAKKIIVEINTATPADLEGIHDIYQPDPRPGRGPIPIYRASDRIGDTAIKVDPEKIVAIVHSNIPDDTRQLTPADEEQKRIAGFLLDFLENEVHHGRLPKNLLPLQAGVGVMANAVFAGLADSQFEDLEVYSEVLQDSMVDLLDMGKLKVASAAAMTLSPDRLRDVLNNLGRYKDKVILRPQEISNHPEVIRRLGIIAINAALECDIYGNVNSTHVMGTHMMNGIGGSGDFARNAYLSIFVCKSTAKKDTISTILPMVSHVDHTEHDVQVIVTEQGLADLRGLAPRERARVIIQNCAHPKYRDLLMDYVRDAERMGGHTPHVLAEAFAWQRRYQETGTMLPQAESPLVGAD